MGATAELERLLGTLGRAIQSVAVDEEARGGSAGETTRQALPRAATGGGDAIDRILSAGDRETAVASLRDSDVVNAFRDELTDGLIRVDTANRLLGLVSQIIARLLV